MGLFDIFKKKDCEICGKEVGMFGYKKLEDGEICKDCVKLLSPFFSERRHSTVEQIKAQIASREQNKKELETFRENVSLGEYNKIFIELNGGIPSRFVISASDNYREANADIITFKNVSSYEIDIRDSRNEEKYTNDKGERVSYSPPRYTYSYDFYLKLQITGIPYIDDISVRLNSSSLYLETVEQRSGILGGIMGNNGFDPMLYPEYREYKALCDELSEYFSCGQRGVAYVGAQNAPVGNPEDELIERLRNAPDEETCDKLSRELVVIAMNNPERGEEIKERSIDAMTEARIRMDYTKAGLTPPKYEAPDQTANVSWKCFCGNENTHKFCNECGMKMFTPDEIECSECSWTAEDDSEVPSFCPNCGKKLDEKDIR